MKPVAKNRVQVKRRVVGFQSGSVRMQYQEILITGVSSLCSIS